MKLRISNSLKSEKGNAMILALSVILVLMAFGTASLMTSVANIKMGAKFKAWSKDYYALDQNAENKVNQLNTLLETAESYAQNYMAGQYYLYAYGSSELTDMPSELQFSSSKPQDYLHDQWQTVEPYLDDRSNSTYRENQQNFMNNALKRLYYYYASNLLEYYYASLDSDGTKESRVVYLIDAPGKDNYQSELFDSWDADQQAEWKDGKLAVEINTQDNPDPIDPDTVNGKVVSVKVKVLFPTYTVLQQTKKVKGNPIWTNAITAAGSIGFEGSGTSTINGDLFSADKDESLYLNDNEALSNGIYSSNGSDAEINGNVYSKGNLHVFSSGSKINVHPYSNISDPGSFTVDLKNKVFFNNGLFFDNNSTVYPTPTDYTYIQQSSIDPADQTLYFVNKDVAGGNIYCNSLVVDQGVSRGEINAYGNVSTFNDIKMNNTIPGSSSNGLNSTISVAKNFIGINSEAHNGDPNASSTVINNTALSGNTITLKGKFVVPGTAFAQYTGIKLDGAAGFSWPNRLYYQTGESITANNSDIYSAYMVPVNPDHAYPGYDYVFDQYTNDAKPQPYDETNISSYYLMRGKNTDGSDSDNTSLLPKINQLADYLGNKIANNLSGKPVTKVFSGPTGLSWRPPVNTLSATQPTTGLTEGYRYINTTDQKIYTYTSESWDSGVEPNSNWAVIVVDTGEEYVFDGGTWVPLVEGYSLGVALLHPNDNDTASTANVYYDPTLLPNIPSAYQPRAITNYTDYQNHFKKFQSSLSKIFLSKVQNLGTVKKMPISFESFIDKSTGYKANIQDSVDTYVDKSVVIDSNGILNPAVNSDPSGTTNSFVYIQQTDGSPYTLNLGSYSGIIYSERNLNITGAGSFRGAIICEGDINVASGATVTYDKGVIQNVLASNDVAYDFFYKLISFENPVNKSLGFVDKSAVLDSNGTLRSGISSQTEGMSNSFVYIQPPTGSDTSTLDIPDDSSYSGIIYCEGNLKVTGSGSFNGAIICEGNVKILGNATITYDEGVIQAVLAVNGKVREFFAPGAMGWDTNIAYSTTAYDGAVRQVDTSTSIKRLHIVEWKEEQE